ncbi:MULTISPECIES: hypothetical protein [Erysipelothrix]|uniref:hypothetical protein n=1 Tax=Erysipelothrix TaxID=1647 RepID=UPI00140A7D87|nr:MULTISPECIES: hypothetical protein [Erysipelothrix]MDV7678458.1 hypothetical protein [Erysipelothrix rhusiopathiae]WMT70158.1 hypothetical protein K0H77_01210 [Erysipelothrix rhusiopathiae]
MYAEKGIIQDMISFMFYAILILFILSIAILFKNIGDNDHFSKHTSNILSRYGECSVQAKEEIQAYSNVNFGGRYVLTECSSNGIKFGSLISFKAEGDFSLMFIELPFKLRFGGTATVMKRTY